MGITQFLKLPGEHSIFYYLLLLVVGAIALQALATGMLFFFKRSGEWRANTCFGLLLLAFGLTQTHYILLITGLSERFPILSVLPLYYTLLFPPLLFYHIKLNLYPAYRFRWTDAKHFVLPLAQCVFFFVMLVAAIREPFTLERAFFNPFYGSVETAAYIVTFFAYLLFGYRYIRQKRSALRSTRDVQLVRYLSNLVKVLFFLFIIHTGMMVSDFVSYELLHLNLRFFKPFAALGILSFSALTLWLGIYGFQVLVWGRKVLR